MTSIINDDTELNKRQIIAARLLPEAKMTPEEIFKKYPPRHLTPGAMVTRIAPSPTGFMHIGGVYAALISERLAHQSDGVFYLRIEDTDKSREVLGATDLIIKALKTFSLNIDEGEIAADKELGAYGPYKQSNRKAIYQSFIKTLVEDGSAYAAFESAAELEEINAQQVASKVAPGYYGHWATWREKSADEVLAALDNGLQPVIRLRSNGNPKNIIEVDDMFKGKLRAPENTLDVVILKSDGVPTYHFAHVVDDYLMGTTHVVRGDEWIASLPLHVQLFDKMAWPRPVYGHLAPIQKLDGNSRRKLSKRHDPEASVSFYSESGYPPEAVIMYLLNLANSGFEEWLLANPSAPLEDYKLSITELQKGAGALLDLQKMSSFSKNFIGALSVEKTIELALIWAREYDAELARVVEANINYTSAILNIDRASGQARKDIAKWSDLRSEIGFFFDDIFSQQEISDNELAGIAPLDITAIATQVATTYNETDDKDTWLNKMRALGVGLGFAPDVKTFKQSPADYKGHFGDVAKVVRVLLVGRNQSPDLYEVMRVLGLDRVKARLQK